MHVYLYHVYLYHGFSQTPAERIKAKIKLMVEKSKIPQPPSETFVPSPSQLASIESDAFEQVNFSSTRATGNSQVHCIYSGTSE